MKIVNGNFEFPPVLTEKEQAVICLEYEILVLNVKDVDGIFAQAHVSWGPGGDIKIAVYLACGQDSKAQEERMKKALPQILAHVEQVCQAMS